MSQHAPLLCWLAFMLAMAAVLTAVAVCCYDGLITWLERRYTAYEERQWRKDRRRDNDR